MNRSFITTLFVLVFVLGLSNCSHVPNELKNAEQLMETAPDSALHILQHIPQGHIYGRSNHALYALLMSQALDKNDIKLETDSLITIATDYFNETDPVHAGYAWFYHARTARNNGNVEEQANNLLRAQEYAEKSKDIKLLGAVDYDKADMYFNQKQYNNSKRYFKDAANYFNQIKDEKSYILSVLYVGYCYLNLSKTDSTQIFYKQAENRACSINNKVLLSVILRNIGSLHLMKKDYNQALQYFHKAPLTKINIYDSNKYYLLADVYIQINRLDSAKYYLNKVTDLHEMAPAFYKLWQEISEKENNKTKALYYANKVSFATDSLYKKKLETSFAGLESKYKYQSLQVANQELTIKTNETKLLLLLVTLCLGIFGVLYLIRQLHINRKEAEYQTRLANQRQELVEKEKENTAKEIENNALLAKQLKFQSILLLNLEQHRDNSVKQPGLWKNKNKELKSERNKTFNEELLACMDFEYNNISQRLKDDFPDLSDNDIITCCLILAGFETGMIATIFDVKNESILIRRSRIRKKLKLQESENLEHFLLKF